jgi:hypothetical protein
MNILKHSIFFFMCGLLSSTSLAATVSNYYYISSEIAKADDLTYDQLAEFFSKTTSLKYECFYDENLQTKNDIESYEVFTPYISYAKTGELQFTFTPLEVGFNILAKRVESTESKTPAKAPAIETLLSLEASLTCASGKESGTCSSLSFGQDKEFVIETPSDDFSDQASRGEEWRIYFVKDRIYTERHIDYTVVELNWLGARKGSIDFNKREVCVLSE